MLHQGWLLEGWGRNVVDLSTGSVRPQGRIKEYLFFGERNPVPEDRATWLKRYLIGLLLDMGAGVSKSWTDVSAALYESS